MTLGATKGNQDKCPPVKGQFRLKSPLDCDGHSKLDLVYYYGPFTLILFGSAASLQLYIHEFERHYLYARSVLVKFRLYTSEVTFQNDLSLDLSYSIQILKIFGSKYLIIKLIAFIKV